MEKDVKVGVTIITKEKSYTIIDMKGYALNRYGLIANSEMIGIYSKLEYIARDFQNGNYGEVIGFSG